VEEAAEQAANGQGNPLHHIEVLCNEVISLKRQLALLTHPPGKRFLVFWSKTAFPKNQSDTVPFSFFGPDNAYEPEEVADIDALAVGQTWFSAAYGPAHTVTRLA
jgi:hypothetical protein